MSSGPFAWAKETRTGSASRKAVLLLLAEYADEEGSCFPSQRRIADETELSERSVRTALGDLESAGLIRRERRNTQNGHRTSDRIYLCLPANDVSPRHHVVHPTGNRASGLPANPASTPYIEVPEEPPSSLVPHGTRDGNLAKMILNEWWERQDPRPQQPYPAMLKVLTKALSAGWSEDDLRKALDEVLVVSGGALDMWRRKRDLAASRSTTAEAKKPNGWFVGGKLV